MGPINEEKNGGTDGMDMEFDDESKDKVKDITLKEKIEPPPL